MSAINKFSFCKLIKKLHMYVQDENNVTDNKSN